MENEMQVPYIVHESAMARMERVNRRLLAVIIILIILLAATNGAWIWYENQFTDEVTETVETSSEGGGNAYGTLISGNNSEVNYGQSESDAKNDKNP